MEILETENGGIWGTLNMEYADHSGREVLLERWDRGFESHSRRGCLGAFMLCLCCSVSLRRADPCPWSPTECI
jgi:hypothetical protein